MTSELNEFPPRAERRPSPRRRVFRGGLLVYADGAQRVTCVITELTAQGARVEMPIVERFPERVYLINAQDRIAYQARVVWTSRSAAGLLFTQTLPLANITDPKLAYLKRLWRDGALR